MINISALFHSMKAGSKDHLNSSSEALHEEDTSAPSDVRHEVVVFLLQELQI